MSVRIKVSKRQQVAHAKKMAIINSPAFKTWWAARQTFYPTPSDPYRAFMIDIGLFARVMHKEVWQHRTNRMDYPPVDLPKDVPRRRRKLPPRKHIKRFKVRPKAAQPIPLTPLEKEFMGRVEKFTEKYHLPAVGVRFEPRAYGAFYRPSIFGTPMIVMPKEYVAGGEKIAGVRKQVSATLFHEAGHHAHAAYGGIAKIRAEGLSAILTKPFPEAKRIEKERIAWAVAKKHLGVEWDPIKGWRKRFAFGTYLGITPL